MSTQKRNKLLTEDPGFQFDTVVYPWQRQIKNQLGPPIDQQLIEINNTSDEESDNEENLAEEEAGDGSGILLIETELKDSNNYDTVTATDE